MLRSFFRLADLLEERKKNVLGALCGCETLSVAETEFEKTVRALRSYSNELPYLTGRRPMGTVYAALPFNNPLYSLILYCFGPLLVGNEVRCRPSSLTARVVDEITDIARPVLDVLPLRIVHDTGMAFIDDAISNADCILFTGSWANVEQLRSRVKQKLVFSGQGLNPFGILQDAAFSSMLPIALRARLYNSGQDCLSAERYYVQRPILNQFIDEVVAAITSLSVGYDPQADLGPLIAEAPAQAVAVMVKSSYPGREVILEGPTEGRLVSPSVVLTTSQDPIVLAEKYAPVFTIVPFDDVLELNSLMNDCAYLFGATVCGAVGLGQLQLEHPHVALNSCLLSVEESDAHVPFGGRRRSGFVQDGTVTRDGPILFSVETSLAGITIP